MIYRSTSVKKFSGKKGRKCSKYHKIWSQPVKNWTFFQDIFEICGLALTEPQGDILSLVCRFLGVKWKLWTWTIWETRKFRIFWLFYLKRSCQEDETSLFRKTFFVFKCIFRPIDADRRKSDHIHLKLHFISFHLIPVSPIGTHRNTLKSAIKGWPSAPFY